MSNKYFVVREWTSYDVGGMEKFEFDTIDELHQWIKQEYPELSQFEKADITIIYGETIRIEIEEVEIIKRIKRGIV